MRVGRGHRRRPAAGDRGGDQPDTDHRRDPHAPLPAGEPHQHRVPPRLGSPARLGTRGELEDQPHPVRGLFLAGTGDVAVGRDESEFPRGGGHARADTDLAGGARVEGGAVHVDAAPAHRGTRVDVLGHGVFEEPLGREDRHVGVRVDDAENPAEVVGVRVGVDHARHRAVAPVPAVEGQRRRCRLRRDQRVDHHHPTVAFEQRHVR